MADGLDCKTLVKLQQALARGSAKRCNEALGCKLRQSATVVEIDSKLIHSTSKATILLGLLTTKLWKYKNNDCTTTLREGKDNDENDILSLEQTLKALLMIDSSYSTPWRALCEFASVCHGVQSSSLINCVTMIEEFLHQQSTAQIRDGPNFQTPAKERPHEFPSTSPGGMVLHFARILSDQYLMLHDGKSGDSVNDDEVNSTQFDASIAKPNEELFFPLLMDLLYTTVTTTRDWNNESLQEKTVATVHLRPPPLNRSMAWLRMAYDLRFVLSGGQLQDIGQVCLNQLWNKSVYLGDPSALLNLILDLANHSTSLLLFDTTRCKHDAKLWRRIAIVAFYQSCVGSMDECSVVEECLARNLFGWDIATIEIWIAEIKDECNPSLELSVGNILPSWFVWNGIVVCFEALRNKRSVSYVLPWSPSNPAPGRAIEGCQRDGKDSICPYHSIVLESAFANSEGWDETLFDRLDEIQYNDGLFLFGDGNEVKPLSSCASGVIQSLFLGTSISERSHKMNTNVVSRAGRMVSLVDAQVINCCESRWQKMAIFAATVKTVVFFEIYATRTAVVNKIREDLRKNSSDHRLTRCHLSVIRLIFASNRNKKDRSSLLEPFCDIFDRDMHASIFVELVHTMASLSEARTKILQCAKRMINPSYACNFGCDVESTHHCRSLRSGILGLFELIRREDWTATELEAWTSLSNIMVSDLPPISSTNRRWLYDSIETFIVNGTSPVKFSERLVRALAIRLGLFVNCDNRSFLISGALRSRTSHARHDDDILSLHRLLSVALRYLATAGADFDRRSVLLAQGREAFLRSILVQRGGEAPRHHIIENFFNRGLRSYDGEPDTFLLCWYLFLFVNVELMTHLCCGSEKSHMEQTLGSSTEITLVSLIESIEKVEIGGLRSASALGGRCIEGLPSWLSNLTLNHSPRSERVKKEADTFATTKESFGDLLIELLFIAPFPAPGSDHFVDPLCWKFMTGIGILIRQRQLRLKEGLTVNASEDDVFVALLSTETIILTAESFLSVSSMVIRDAIHRDCALSVFEELILPVLAYCDALHLATQRFEERDCSALTICLWDLYQSVASESASLTIIQYMESHLSENVGDGVFAADEKYFSLASMRSQKDVDKAMQTIRCRCLLPIQNCLFFGAVDEKNGERKPPTESIDFLGGILAALSRDLQIGLQGRSGGITRELFLAYCCSIEKCSTLIFDCGMTSRVDLAVISLFAQVATTLTEILIVYPLRDAVLFRTTFILAAAVLPSMCRDLLRKGLCLSQERFPDMNNLFGRDSVLLHRTLEDSVEILTRWARLREPMLVPWSDIAGPEHADTDEIDIEEDQAVHKTFISSLVSLDESQISPHEIPRVVHVPSPRRLKRTSEPVKARERIRLHTKEVWSWTLSCSLLGLEQIWLESQRIILTNHSSLDQKHLRQSSDWSSFYKVQQRELQKSLVVAIQFLRASADSSLLDECGNRIILDVLASNLPSAPRLRLCCAIECIFQVVTHAINHAYECLVAGRENSTTVGMTSLSFLESLCCLSAWLSSPATMDGDLSTGVFKWLEIVSRNSSPGELTTNRPSGVGLRLRVSHLAELAHGLHSKLRLLQSCLQANVVNPIQRDLTFITNAFFTGDGDGMEYKILDMVSSRLQFIQTVVPEEFKLRHLPDFPFNQDSIDRGSREMGRKRSLSKTRYNRRKASKERTTNNRNKIVNIFMDLDREIESEETRFARDAYADLEDFLVEG